jgi:hypothetical protein
MGALASQLTFDVAESYQFLVLGGADENITSLCQPPSFRGDPCQDGFCCGSHVHSLRAVLYHGARTFNEESYLASYMHLLGLFTVMKWWRFRACTPAILTFRRKVEEWCLTSLAY